MWYKLWPWDMDFNLDFNQAQAQALTKILLSLAPCLKHRTIWCKLIIVIKSLDFPRKNP